MTTTEHPQGAQLTRRQLRELQLREAAAAEPAGSTPDTPVAPAAAPLPRAATTVVPPAPSLADIPHDADGDAHPRTRREARELDRVRTASVPVQGEGSTEPVLPEIPLLPDAAAQKADAAVVDAKPAAAVKTAEAAPAVAAPAPEKSAPSTQPEAPAKPAAAKAPKQEDAPKAAPVAEKPVAEKPAAAKPVAEKPAAVAAPAAASAARVSQSFGDAVDVNDTAPQQSFDSLLGRDIDTSGSATSAHALIYEDAALPPLTAPVTSNGETLLTGTFALPESLSSQGHVGAADGKDVDAVLIDGELPPTSSPTPIAATAAVSQAKTPGEIIKPPAPEKSNKLMLALAITAGALAVTLGVVVVVAFLTGALTQ